MISGFGLFSLVAVCSQLRALAQSSPAFFNWRNRVTRVSLWKRMKKRIVDLELWKKSAPSRAAYK